MEATLSQPAARAGNGNQRPAKSFGISSGVTRRAHGVLLYGTGGIGKSTLASAREGVLFVDIEGGTKDIETQRVDGITTWADLRLFLQTADLSGVKAIAIDTVTAAEDMCRQHVLATVPAGKGKVAQSLEDYGFGKGPTYLLEEWKRLLADLDQHRRSGRDVILIAHERVGKVPNPAGDDYIRYEPRLFTNGQVSLMYITKEWADHVLFVSYDVAASEGKARGDGTRTIYPSETATYMAKSRTLGTTPIVFPEGSGELWNLINNSKRTAPVAAAPEL
jgi:hypothetical protein